MAIEIDRRQNTKPLRCVEIGQNGLARIPASCLYQSRISGIRFFWGEEVEGAGGGGGGGGGYLSLQENIGLNTPLTHEFSIQKNNEAITNIIN